MWQLIRAKVMASDSSHVFSFIFKDQNNHQVALNYSVFVLNSIFNANRHFRGFISFVFTSVCT